MIFRQFFWLLCLNTCLVINRPLSAEDNDKLLNSCGKSEHRWIVTVHSAGGECTGALISPRHVLTSTHCIAKHENGEWKQNSLNYFPNPEREDCDKNNNSIVYEILASKVTVHLNGTEIGRARYIFLFGYCKITEQGYLYESPDDLMMIEFAEDVTYSQYLQPACFSRNMEDHDPDVSLNFYSYDFKSNNVEKKRVKVVNERKKGTVKRQGDSLILTTSGVTGCSNFKDGLVARRIDGKLMIVGALIQNSCETKEKGGWEVYESVAYHSIHFCELAGLCPPEVKVNSASCLLEFLVISFTFLSFYAQ